MAPRYRTKNYAVAADKKQLFVDESPTRENKRKA